MEWLKRLFHREPQPIVVVSGLPRSGTSMMMRMLEAGGMDVLIDHIREPNADNPKGYYEFERVKKLPDGDVAWLADAQGRAVKIIAALLTHLPDTYTYKVLFMQRHIEEVLASQKRMLVRRGEDPDKVNDIEMARLFESHVEKVYTWIAKQPHITHMNVDYNEMLVDPMPQILSIRTFLKRDLDVAQMTATVDPALYRQRHGTT